MNNQIHLNSIRVKNKQAGCLFYGLVFSFAAVAAHFDDLWIKPSHDLH